MATTRNAKLDELCKGSSLGAEPLAKDLSKIKLQFGVMTDEKEGLVEHVWERGRIKHVGFGIEGNVQNLEKGQICY
ncbi:MAG: hypothetical protein MMC33_006870 [Icmadophila ericetorum]|nr:hypothetical protein [Icmadophila ericetorum]